jgi:serine/threonine protein kinase
MAKTGSLIKLGYKMLLDSGGFCEIKDFIGSGGQGEVYTVNAGGRKFALKWYYDRMQTPSLRNSLKMMIRHGSPSEAFLWPLRLVEHEGKFGYIMDLRPKEYVKSQWILSRKINLTYTTACNACLQLADAFRKLHIAGLSYHDVSLGNLFINPDTGDVLLCDNENVTVHGESVTGIAGTPGFMAPEIVRGEQVPDIYTDRFSLAILMFRMLFIEHPFDGKRWADADFIDTEFEKKIYGTDPIFIFDPRGTNPPCPNTQGNANLFWALWPKNLRDMFVKTFTEGIRDRQNARSLETEWIDGFRTVLDGIFPCPYCGASNIYGLSARCMKSACGKILPLPSRLKIASARKERMVALNFDTKLKAYQLNPALSDSFDEGLKVIGVVVQDPSNNARYGLRNMSDGNWFYSLNGGQEKVVIPGKAVVLNRGLRLNFGSVTGETIL